MSTSSSKGHYVDTHNYVYSPAALIFTKVLPELLALVAIAAPVLAFVGIGLLHSGLYLIITGSATFTTLIVPVMMLILAVCVILFRNPVHSLLSLIGVFISAFVMYVALKAQYLAYVFLIVYVGAVAILFLFVVMLLNVKALHSQVSLITSTSQIVALLVGALLCWHLLAVLNCGYLSFIPNLMGGLFQSAPFSVDALVYAVDSTSDVLSFAVLFDTRAVALFILILFILLTAMLGAIIQATKSMEINAVDSTALEARVAATRKG